MATDYTAVVKQEGEWWVGWIEELPEVKCRERTREELMESLRLALEDAFEVSLFEKD